MKPRWLIITVLLAFPFAFAFFLREARLGEKRVPKPAPTVPAPPVARDSAKRAPTSSDMSPMTPMGPIGAISETTKPTAPSSDEQVVELSNGGFTVSPKPTLFEGTVTREGGNLLYESDAKLRLSGNVILSSPTGVMVSNEKQTLFAGDMQIEAAKNTITAHEGTLDTTTGKMTALIASISFTNDNNQLIRMTGENVTLELPSNPSSTTTQPLVADALDIKTVPTTTPTNAPSPAP
jgi:hypothetical protein